MVRIVPYHGFVGLNLITFVLHRLSTVEHIATHFGTTETVSIHSATPERFEMIDAAVRHGSDTGSGGERIADDTSSLNETEWTRVHASNDSETGSGGGEDVRGDHSGRG